MNKQYLIILCVCLLLVGCHNKSVDYKEMGDADLTIQLSRLAINNGQQNYRIRLTPARKILESNAVKNSENLRYHMDSCFYLLHNGQKIYPVLVQYVANGSGKSFEYLLEFEKIAGEKRNDRLICECKYWNTRRYLLKI